MLATQVAQPVARVVFHPLASDNDPLLCSFADTVDRPAFSPRTECLVVKV